jgi:AcrR family transcriptional regulator
VPEAVKAKWGDRAGRRRDILAAARNRIEEAGGYLDLNMRDLAADAGVSPGTLYSYFRTKEEIFATLYAAELEQYADTIAPLCENVGDLESLLIGIITPYRDCYVRFGQYLNIWSLFQDPEAMKESPRELRRALRRAAGHIRVHVETGIERISREQGVELPKGEPVVSLLYAVINGLCDQYTTERHLLHRRDWDDMVSFAVHVLVTGLTTPARQPAV